jgi:4-amino-4-deoxy-L-arabinose transferase-like glycosyltransferase
MNREQATKVNVNYPLLFFGCLVFHIAGTWSLPLIDRDEPRFAEASREMIERSDYIVPHFNNQLRLDKPPLAYWVQVGSYKIFGENDFAARFPSAIAAALTALVIFAWGSRLPLPARDTASQARIGAEKIGWWAAIIFTLSLQAFLHAKAAVADMWLVLFVTLAHWAGSELVGFSEQRPTSNVQRPTSNSEGVEAPLLRPTSDPSWWWIFYLSLALAFLAKGPIGWTPLLTVGSTVIFARDVQLARRFKFVRGLALMIAIVALWGIPALIQTHGEFWQIGIGRHVIGRSLGAMEGHGANSLGIYIALLPFYFVTIFWSFFPWSIKLPWLARTLWRGRRTGISDPGSNRDKNDSYLLAGTAIIFVIFSVLKTKLPHYTLPAFPLLTLLLARRWIAEELPTSFFKRTATVVASIYLVIALFATPLAARMFPSWELYRKSREYLRPEMDFGAVAFNEPSLVWYFRSRVHGFMTTLKPDDAVNFIQESGPRFLILPTDLMLKLFPNPPASWKTVSTHGFNVAKGRFVDLTLVLKLE